MPEPTKKFFTVPAIFLALAVVGWVVYIAKYDLFNQILENVRELNAPPGEEKIYLDTLGQLADGVMVDSRGGGGSLRTVIRLHDGLIYEFFSARSPIGDDALFVQIAKTFRFLK